MACRCAVVLCVLGLSLTARAQSTAASGMCGGMMTGTIGLAVPQGNGNFLTIPSSQITTGVFGTAECQCASASGNPDINLEIKLTTALPASTAGTAEIWVGDSSCTNVTTRTSSSNTTCERIATPTIQDFTINSTGTSSSGLHYVLKADALSQPFKHMCDPSQPNGPMQTAANSVYVFIFTDVNNPLATCSLTLSERLQGPDPVTNTSASGGDGAVSLNWKPPVTGTYSPSFFQVLCSDDCGQPIKDSANKQIYSVCENGTTLSRRDLTSGGSSGGSGGTDGGTGSTDMAFASATVDVRDHSWYPNVAACPADMGTISTADGGIFGPGSTGPFASLDPRYICSDQITPSSTGTRIGGLTNGQSYHFLVLSVDAYGNATASPRIDGSPQPTEDLWRRYRDAGGGGGGCFIATAAFGSYENRWVWVLRDFRDRVLLEHDSGRSFVEWYYAHSPRAAAWIGAHGWARAVTRVALAPLIAGAWFWLYVPPWQQAAVVTLLLAFALRKRIRRHLADAKRDAA
ncbi:MAG TPA: CFI-box-CTERM domain-containing protein [Polyangia bacterium]